MTNGEKLQPFAQLKFPYLGQQFWARPSTVTWRGDGEPVRFQNRRTQRRWLIAEKEETSVFVVN